MVARSYNLSLCTGVFSLCPLVSLDPDQCKQHESPDERSRAFADLLEFRCETLEEKGISKARNRGYLNQVHLASIVKHMASAHG